MPRLKRIEHPKEFVELRNIGLAKGDKNFCSVMSVAVAAGISFEQASKLMQEVGRKKGRGLFLAERRTKLVMNDLGFTVTSISPFEFIRRYPGAHKGLRSATTHHPRRFPGVWNDGHTYIVLTPRHMCTVRKGELIDWAVNRSLRVDSILRIEKGPDLVQDAHVLEWAKRYRRWA